MIPSQVIENKQMDNHMEGRGTYAPVSSTTRKRALPLIMRS